METLKSEYLPTDSTDEEIESRMEELCAEYEQAFATVELTSQGYHIKVTDEPQS